MPKFSIITPVNLWNLERVEQFLVCIDSVKKQSFRDFEWVVIDDGSTQEFLWDNILNSDIPSVNIIHKDHEERVIALNEGLSVAKGEWIIFLDSDDELFSQALGVLDRIIKSYKTYKMFNFGAIYNYKDGKITKGNIFRPKKKKVGHEVFGGGNIANGTFIFHRSVYEDLGGYPPREMLNVDCTPINYGGIRESMMMNSPFNFSAAAQLEFPEIRKYFMVNFEDEPDKIIKELGNPWGQDYYIFYKYTRKYHSKPLEEYLYLVHPKI